jgi:hypothetical protein
VEVIVAYVKIMSWYLPVRVKVNHRIPQSGQLASWLIIKWNSSQMQVWCISANLVGLITTFHDLSVHWYMIITIVNPTAVVWHLYTASCYPSLHIYNYWPIISSWFMWCFIWYFVFWQCFQFRLHNVEWLDD